MLVVAGETIVDLIEMTGQPGEFKACTGGGPYNVAKAAAKMQIPVGYISPISTDFFGEDFAREMDSLNISMLAPRSHAPSGLAIVKKDETGHPSYSFYRNGAADRDVDMAKIQGAMPSSSTAFYIGGLAIADGDDAEIWVSTMETIDQPTFIDPNIRPTFINDREEFLTRLARAYDASDIIKLSDEDIAWIAPETAPRAYMDQIMARHNIELGLLTMGSAGGFAIADDKEFFVAAPKVDVIDTVGAGDCFSASTLAFLSRAGMLSTPARADLEALLTYAVTAAAINVTRAGANAPTHEEIMDFLNR